MKVKALRTLYLLITCFFAGQLTAQTPVIPSGTGTSGDPYQVATLNNLYWITQNSASWSKFFIQTADIDASTTSSWHSGAGLSPIGVSLTSYFTGTYNGQGFIISGLFISRSSTNYVGLLGLTSNATLSNLILTDVNITGSSVVGGIVGRLQGIPGTSITNCYCSGAVNGATYVGMVAGYSTNGTMDKCGSAGASNASTNSAGGLMGYLVSVY